MASGALNSTQLNSSTRPSIRMFDQPPGGKSTVNLNATQEQLVEKESITNSTPMKNNQSLNNTSTNMSSSDKLSTIVEFNDSNINNNTTINISNNNSAMKKPTPPSKEEINNIKLKLLGTENNFISLNNGNSNTLQPHLPFPETVYLEMLTETMFQNGVTTVNQLDEVLNELNHITKQCYMVANVCKQHDGSPLLGGIASVSNTQNIPIPSGSGSTNTNINATTAKGYEDDLNDIFPSVMSTIIDTLQKIHENNLFVVLKDCIFNDSMSTTAPLIITNNNNSNSSNNKQTNLPQSEVIVIIDQLTSCINQLQRVYKYHQQTIDTSHEILIIPRIDFFMLLGESLKAILNNLNILKSNLKLIENQAEIFSMKIFEKDTSLRHDQPNTNSMTPRSMNKLSLSMSQELEDIRKLKQQNLEHTEKLKDNSKEHATKR